MNIKPIITAVALTIGVSPLAYSAPKKVIFDTDFGLDCDDVGTLAVFHSLSNSGEADLLGVMISHKGYYSPGAVDSVNTYYNRPNIPIGSYKGSNFDRPNSQYSQQLAENFPNDVVTIDDVPEARYLYRQLLAKQPNHSVAIVTTGFLANIKALMETGPDQYSKLTGIELVRQKVSELTIVGGVFDRPEGGTEYNLAGGYSRKIEETSVSKYVVNNWPTPLTFSGGPIGQSILTGPVLQQTPDTNPVKKAYEIYHSGNWGNAILNGNGSWDQTAAIYAIRGIRDYWHLNTTGHAYIDDKGYSVWKNSPDTDQAHLDKRMSNDNLAKVISGLMSSKPIKPPVTTRSPLTDNPNLPNDDSNNNLAFNKPNKQSSTYFRGYAIKGNDGKTAGHWRNGSGSVIHTRRQNQPWWQVDLGQQANLNKVVLWPRTDCCSKRLSNLYIFVSPDPFDSTTVNGTLAQAGVQAFRVTDTVTAKRSISMQASGRYVRVQLIANNQILNMAELEVFGNFNLTEGPVENIINLAPKVSAGKDFSTEHTTTIKLKGAISDDGLPVNPGTTTQKWSKVSGPGTVNINNASKSSTSVSFSLPGSYRLRLTASDGQLTSSDDITITVIDTKTGPETEPENLARGKKSQQSSTYHRGYASKGNDGNAAGHWRNGVGSVIHTQRENQPWWQVDLGQQANLDKVVLWPRTDCCSQRLSNLYVFVSPEPFDSTTVNGTLAQAGVQAFRVSDTVTAKRSISMQASGRYVRVQLIANNQILNMAELEVFGTTNNQRPVVPAPGKPENLTDGKTSQQSSTYFIGYAHKANDNNTLGHWRNGTGSVIHTQREHQPWWQTDLGQQANLQEIILWPRTDCCSQRLSNLYVFVSSEPFTSTAVSSTLLQKGVQAFHVSDTIRTKRSIPLQASGRYIRVQLIAKNEMLNMAEFKAIGTFQPVNRQAAASESALSKQTAKANGKNVTISIQGSQAKVAYVKNMALGKSSQQSSTYYTGFSHKGNDGNTDGSMFSDANSVIHTKREDQPWWQVDLGQKTRLEEVVLWPRIDCCAQELSNLYVFISLKPFTSSSVSDTLAQPGVQAFRIADIISAKRNIPMQAEGRYVRVQLIDNDRMLNMAELEAMGLAIE